MACLYVDTSFFIGRVNAWCMDSPMNDLTVGNIDGARDPIYPDDTWTVNAVLTGQQVKNLKKLIQL